MVQPHNVSRSLFQLLFRAFQPSLSLAFLTIIQHNMMSNSLHNLRKMHHFRLMHSSLYFLLQLSFMFLPIPQPLWIRRNFQHFFQPGVFFIYLLLQFRTIDKMVKLHLHFCIRGVIMLSPPRAEIVIFVLLAQSETWSALPLFESKDRRLKPPY